MSSAPPALPTCSSCQTTLDPNGTCPQCRAPEDWADQIEAVEFILRRLREWQQEGRLSDRQLQTFTDLYDRKRTDMQSASASGQRFKREPNFPARDECWSCHEYLHKNKSHCTECGAPITYPAVKSLRYWRYLLRELQQHEESGRLTLRQGHDLIAEAQERIDGLQRKLERDRAAMVIPVEEEPSPRRSRRVRSETNGEMRAEPDARSRTFMEVLLDPQTVQWLLLSGGGLIVLGLVIWLASLGIFDNPGFIAIALAAGNAALLAAGYALILRTRFQIAGRALTLLACLLMPLNLWFYHTHELMTLEDNLWIAALVCCVIYTASALILKDPLFVYVLVGGLALTGLLVLAQINRFGEVLSPTLLLIGLGLICLHAERAFPPGEGPFSRERFGMAFFWSSQPLFAVGLLLLLGAQIVGWLFDPIFRHMLAELPDVAKRAFLPYTLGIVLAGTYAYVYSDLVVRRIGIYLYLAAITLLWAEIQILVLANLAETGAIVIITLALTGLVINILQTQLESQQPFLRRAFPVGLLLSIIALAYGTILHLVNVVSHDVGQPNLPRMFAISWPHVVAMAVLAIGCRASAFLYRHRMREVSVIYFFLTAAATLVFAAGLTWMLGLLPWETEAPLLMLIPVLYLVASYLYRGHSAEQPLVWCGHAATLGMILCSLWVAAVEAAAPELLPPRIEGREYNLLLAAFCLEATFFYGLAGVLHRSQVSFYLAAVMFCGAVWQLLFSFKMPNEFYPVAFALTGFVLLILYRVGVFERLEMPSLDRGIYQSANALTTIGFVAGALLSLSRLFLGDNELANLDPQRDFHGPLKIQMYLLIFLLAVSILSAWLVQHPIWRRVHIVLSIVNGLLLLFVIHRLFHFLSPWQKLELFSILLGVVMLGFAFAGWGREDERSSDLVSIGFLFGSLALVVPMFIAAVVYKFVLIDPRTQHHYHEPGWNDLGIVFACVALFGSGVMCRIKSITLVGAVTMILYLLMILIEAIGHLSQLWMIGIYLALGGVVLFGAGLFLSMYRERLLTLPDRIRRREGIFRIMDWR